MMSRSDPQRARQIASVHRHAFLVTGALRGRKGHRRDDGGFTVIELSITMIVFSIIAALTLTLVTSMLNNSASINDTLMGVAQASVADRSFTEYLRSISEVYGVNTNGDTLQFIADVGTGTHAAGCPGQSAPASGVEVICNEDVTATLVTTPRPTVDELEVFFGSSWTTSSDRLIASFDLVPPGNHQAPAAQLFQYYTLSGTTLTNEGATWAAANLNKIQGIGFDAAFLPPPGPGKWGSSAELATVVHTIAFIRNTLPTG
jgi:prepilin-type N-terminal cleavage/methylation domain-containing protein